MNEQLNDLLKKHNSQFNWNEENKTWCLSGIDKGNAWETDDYEADNQEEAENDAINYLIAYNE
jgi:hypothetical protein